MAKQQETYLDLVKREQGKVFVALVKDLMEKTPETTGLGWMGWRLVQFSTPDQDPFKDGGRGVGDKWEPMR